MRTLKSQLLREYYEEGSFLACGVAEVEGHTV